MNTNRFRMTALVALASMGAGALAPNEAMAWHSRRSASNCRLDTNTVLSFGKIENDDTSFSRGVVCPIIDTDAQPRFSAVAGQSLSTLNVLVDSQSTSPLSTNAQACMNDYQSFSSDCGNAVDSVSGANPLALGSHLPTEWTSSVDAGWFAYVFVTLGRFVGGGHEYLFGYYYSN